MKVGVTQVAYEKGIEKPILQHFTTRELLDDISSHGIRHVKLWIKNHPFDGCGRFDWRTRWGTPMESCVSDVPVIEDMDRVWRHPKIDTYAVRFLCPAWAGEVFEEEPTFEIARKLLKRYGHLDKTVIITNWEGDWQWRGTPPLVDDEKTCRQRLKFLMHELVRRQKSVAAARALYPNARMRVLHSAVVNFTTETDENFYLTACRAIADLHRMPDLIGLSHWGLSQPLAERLKYIQDTTGLPADRIYVDEVGSNVGPEQEFRLDERLAVAEAFGCPYAFIWMWKQTWHDGKTNLGLWEQSSTAGRVEWGPMAPGLRVVQKFQRQEVQP